MIAIVLLSLGAISTVPALSVGTCTQGDAANLYGGFLALPFYLAGLAAAIVSPPRPALLLAAVPAIAVALWHSHFAIGFAWNYWLRDFSACHAMLGEFPAGEAGEWMDGGEPLLTVLWLALAFLFWAALALCVRSACLSSEKTGQVQHDGRRPDG